MKHYATAEDFKMWAEKAKSMSEASLRFTINDCQQAARAMATLPEPNKENFYIDQALTFGEELLKRIKKKDKNKN